jgi:hypothetical protein
VASGEWRVASGENRGEVPPTRVFCEKSLQPLENKGWEGAKKPKESPKSPQEYKIERFAGDGPASRNGERQSGWGAPLPPFLRKC